MNVLQRQIIICLVTSVVTFLFFTVSLLLTFLFPNWTLLWKQKILDIPFILFTFVISSAIGLLFGILFGLPFKDKLHKIEDKLKKITKGETVEQNEHINIKELDEINLRIDQVQHHLIEQTKLTQKLAGENAKEQEKRLEEIISQERQRLARELHDSVSQNLFAASMLISTVKGNNEKIDEGTSKQIHLVEEIIQQSQLEMRALLLHLRPVPLKGKSLQTGIEELLTELRQKVPMNIQWKTEQFPLDKGIEDHLFRILQESVSNTLRHAKANTLEVLLIKRKNMAILRIVDDGVGFDVQSAKSGAYGLQNMYERAAEIGGTLQIVSVPHEGTRLEIKVPLLTDEGDKND